MQRYKKYRNEGGSKFMTCVSRRKKNKTEKVRARAMKFFFYYLIYLSHRKYKKTSLFLR